MHDPEVHVRLQDRSVAHIEAQLLAEFDDLTIEELLAVDEFIERIGGHENAYLAIHFLKKLEPLV